jgi:hypothetical protein
MSNAGSFFAAIPLALGFALSVVATGRFLVRIIGLKVSDELIANLTFGLAFYALVGLVIGFLGFFYWPLLLLIGLVPGAVEAARAIPSLVKERPWIGNGARQRITLDVPSMLMALVFILYGIVALIPLVHYDLLVNYLAVPKDYLVQGNLSALEHNIHSSLSLTLHVLISYLLSIGELVNTTPFLFGYAPVYTVFNLTLIVCCVQRCGRIARLMTSDRDEQKRIMVFAGLLWLCMPQTLLQAMLKYPEFFTTFLALSLVELCLRFTPEHRGDVWVIGLLSGLLIAAKVHFVILVGACVLPLVVTTRIGQWLAMAMPTALLVGITQVRNLFAYRHLLFPYSGGTRPEAEAAAALLAENAAAVDLSLGGLARGFWDVLSQQPEGGISLFALLILIRGRVRQPRMWLLGFAPLVALCVLVGQPHIVLRWAQPSLVVLLLMVAANLVIGIDRKSLVTWAATGLVLVGSVLSFRFAEQVIGVFEHFRVGTQTYVARQIPSFPIRARLAQYPGRVLYVGELHGYYGSANGIIPGAQDGRFLERFFLSLDPDAISASLGSHGIQWVSVFHGFDKRLAGAGYWRWFDDLTEQNMRRYFDSLEVVMRENGVTVYAVDR